MTTNKAVTNRENAKKSTGPRTAEGKRRSSTNALRHGLYSNRVVLDHEHAEHFEKLRADLLRDWAPANAQESLLVEQIAQAAWRLQRFMRIETGTFDLLLRTLTANQGIDPSAADGPDPDEGLAIVFIQDRAQIDRMRRYGTALQRSYQDLIRQLTEMQQTRKASEPAPEPPSPRPAERQPKPHTDSHGRSQATPAQIVPITVARKAQGSLASFRQPGFQPLKRAA
ncbi:MAG TPA: hypothetical protein VE621_22400 [Bryobacteraceae bacterium]|nr:hypothetical protein [Bryobacteraceae bacterium]